MISDWSLPTAWNDGGALVIKALSARSSSTSGNCQSVPARSLALARRALKITGQNCLANSGIIYFKLLPLLCTDTFGHENFIVESSSAAPEI